MDLAFDPPAGSETLMARSRIGGLLGLGGLLLVEAAWLGWYLLEPLPNAARAATTLPDGSTREQLLRRWDLVTLGVPYFIPGSTWSESGLGAALAKLARIDRIGDRIPIAGAGLLIGVAGIGLGLTTIRTLRLASRFSIAERIPLAFGLGMPILAGLTLGIGRIGLPPPWAARAGLGLLASVGLGVEILGIARSSRAPTSTRFDWRRWLGFLAVAGPFLILMVLGSMQPSVDFDALEYHLQGPEGVVSRRPNRAFTS